MPASVPKTTRSVPQISVAHDIIAIEHAAGLVAAQFHRHSVAAKCPSSPDFMIERGKKTYLTIIFFSR